MKGKTASPRRTFRLAVGSRLRGDPSGSASALISPQGPIQLNESAAMILELCNGQYTGEEIVTRILLRRDASLADDVSAFLGAAQRRGWILES